MQFRYPCIKCKKPYDSDEEDAYYCPECKAERDAVAEKLDKTFTPKSDPPSDFQNFVANGQTYTDPVTGRKITFGRA